MEGGMRVYVRRKKGSVAGERKTQSLTEEKASETPKDGERRGQVCDAMNKCLPSASSAPSDSSPPSAATVESDLQHSSPLLPNLPDDVALRCIARVPRFYHNDLSLVSKSWRSMLRSPLFFSIRAGLNCNQHLLYVNVNIYDCDSSMWFVFEPNPFNARNLSPVPPIPCQGIDEIFSGFAVLGSKIYVLGGYVNNVPSSTVWILDCRFNRWEIGPKMRVARVSAAVGVLNGKIYVMGGCENSSSLPTDWAEVFDPAVGYWSPIPSPSEVRYTERDVSSVMEKKLSVMIHGDGVVFDPYDSLYWSRRSCVIDEILCYFDWSGYIRAFRLKDGKWEKLEWLQEDLPELLHEVRMANVGGRLCVVWENKENKGPGTPMTTEISCAELDVSEDSDETLWGIVVWSEVILVMPRRAALRACLAVELWLGGLFLDDSHVILSDGLGSYDLANKAECCAFEDGIEEALLAGVEPL